ncbi:MAG: hypothetical protein GTO45_09910 [Candidatus Aminicenantes bacterium]|nr:hypothetical protein [Candidatus Aminicenantes bacterium]NIN18408.1 hypothetical protein [Candidatus Aminicenantes bacterium]NIN42296.1 hypothetical protein [Candidatus Aminicenantes bacterium]NIN85062.1 hypothetical protein [Candidatus Aminicenantes bacterium]NIO81274.1 hypothetical protein [Candidatus Aminicenantes bacterium]
MMLEKNLNLVGKHNEDKKILLKTTAMSQVTFLVISDVPVQIDVFNLATDKIAKKEVQP